VQLILILSVILAVAVPLGVLTYSHVQKAHADSTCNGFSGYSFCHTFDLYFQWTSHLAPPNGDCCIEVHYHLKGAIGYNRNVVSCGDFSLKCVHWYNQQLLAPEVRAWIYTDCATGCVSTTVSQFEIRQYWNGGYDCSDPTFTLTVPWAITITSWGHCTGNHHIATLPGFQQDDVIPYTLNNYTSMNSGAHPSIPDFTDETGQGPCYGADITSGIWEPGTGVDAQGFSAVGVDQTCLPNAPDPNS
jgi:hypothetical protein